MLYVVNYANGEPYETYRKVNSKTAKWFGKADKVIEYSFKDISHDFIDAHKNIFAYKRGAGLWLWKPYLIFKALEGINDGDLLMYLDAGTTVIGDLHYLVRHIDEHGLDIFLMGQPLLSRQFTKRECYVKMGLEDHGENQVVGLLLLIRKSIASQRFIEEWLHLCEDEELLSPKVFHPEIEEFPDLFAHREDQSILNLLRIKYDLPIFRDCSDYGEMPYMNACKEYVYNPMSHNDCNYPTLVLCNRKINPLVYLIKYYTKKIFRWSGLYYTEEKELKKRIY